MNQDAAPESPAAVLPSTCTLYQGDCLNVMPTLAPSSVAMVFADLPYGKLTLAWDLPISMPEFWKNLSYLCRKNAAKAFTATNPFAASLILSNLSEYKYDLVWQKTRPSGAMLAKKTANA